MRSFLNILAIAATALAIGGPASADDDGARGGHPHGWSQKPSSVQLGPRPFFLVDDMSDGPLKRQLQRCDLIRRYHVFPVHEFCHEIFGQEWIGRRRADEQFAHELRTQRQRHLDLLRNRIRLLAMEASYGTNQHQALKLVRRQ